MKIYRCYMEGESTLDERVYLVTDTGTNETTPLRHRVRHSPSGLNHGYGGSGPADLARSLLADYLGYVPHPSLYQKFKSDVVGRFDQSDGWSLTSGDIARWLADHTSDEHWGEAGDPDFESGKQRRWLPVDTHAELHQGATQRSIRSATLTTDGERAIIRIGSPPDSVEIVMTVEEYLAIGEYLSECRFP